MTTTTELHGIGGSDAAAAVGLDPYRSQVQLWLEKTQRVARTPAGEAAEWGTILEPIIAERVAETTEYEIATSYPSVDNLGAVFVSKDHPFMYGHVDRIVVAADPTTISGTPTRGVLEVKTANSYTGREWDDDSVPLKYQVQGAHYLAVTGLDYIVYACLIGGQRLVVRRFERDQEIIEMVIAQEAAFWQMVENDTPPPPDGTPATTAMLSLLYPGSDGAPCSLDDNPSLIAELRQAIEATKVAEAWEAECRNRVKARMQDAPLATLRGVKVASWRTQTTRRVDVTALKAELPDVAQHYTVEQTMRPFRVL